MHTTTTTTSAATRRIVRKIAYNDLPLGGLRFVLMFLTLVFSIVVGALCVKIWTTHHTVQKHLNASLPSGVVSAVLQYADVRTTSILVFLTNMLLTTVVSHIFLAMLQDIYGIVPPSVLRRIGMTLPAHPLTSTSLGYQVVGMLASTACFVAACGVHTAFVFTRSETLGVSGTGATVAAMQGTLDRLGIALKYRDTHYILITAEMAWPAVFFAVSANVVTIVAWWRFSRRASGSVGSVGSELSVEDGTVEEEKKAVPNVVPDI